jgi:putative DNA primase/helicase
MLVLEGPQGVGKSTALQVLSNGWFDTVTSFNGKDPLDKIQGRWIIEIEELDAFNKSEVDSIKSFLTNTNDRYRPAYGHFTVDHPRTCVFAGTTNKNEYLRDETGNRRFWPIQCGQIKNEILRKDLHQLWAETVTRFKKGEAFFINEDARATAIEMQDSRYQGDAWDEVISAYIEEKSAVTYDQIFESVLYIDLNLRDQRSRLRIGKIMRRLGWNYLQVRVGKSKSRKWVKGK